MTKQILPVTPDVIFDSGCRVVKPNQLHDSTCGWPMSPAQVNRHLLVYRCDTERCGRHTAQIPDIEAGLLREYRAWLIYTSPTSLVLSEAELIAGMYAQLCDAWALDGRIRPDGVRFYRAT